MPDADTPVSPSLDAIRDEFTADSAKFSAAISDLMARGPIEFPQFVPGCEPVPRSKLYGIPVVRAQPSLAERMARYRASISRRIGH